MNATQTRQAAERVIHEEPREAAPTNPGADPARTAAALVRFARSDLARARKRGCVLVAQTRRGTLHLGYADGVYTLTALGVASEVLASGRPAAVVPVLVGMYDVGAA